MSRLDVTRELTDPNVLGLPCVLDEKEPGLKELKAGLCEQLKGVIYNCMVGRSFFKAKLQLQF